MGPAAHVTPRLVRKPCGVSTARQCPLHSALYVMYRTRKSSTASYHTTMFCGLSIQWFSSGKMSSSDGTLWYCNASKRLRPSLSGEDEWLEGTKACRSRGGEERVHAATGRVPGGRTRPSLQRVVGLWDL